MYVISNIDKIYHLSKKFKKLIFSYDRDQVVYLIYSCNLYYTITLLYTSYDVIQPIIRGNSLVTKIRVEGHTHGGNCRRCIHCGAGGNLLGVRRCT